MSLDDRIITEDSPKRKIETLQRMLIRANPSLLTQYEVDGIYGSETDQAVREYQAFAGVTQDGIAGPVTLNGLRDLVTIRSSTTNVRAIEMLQEDLMYFYIELPQFGADGDYGNETEAGVERFQSHNDLTVDGIAVPNTLRTMDEERETILLDYGARGSAVRRIQEQLNEHESVDISLEIGGFYGSITQEAVRRFQEANEQKEDGIVGPVTMNLLDLDAFQLSTSEDLEEYLENEGRAMSITESTETETNELLSILQNNTAFESVIPSSAGSIGNAASGKYTQNHADGLVESFIFSANMDGDSSAINLFASFDKEKNLQVFSFIEIEGDLYESPASLKIYDVNGNNIQEKSDTVLELTNAELDIQKEITESLQGASTSSRLHVSPFFLDLDACESPVRFGVSVACAAPFIAASGGTTTVVGLFVGAACSEVLGQPIADAICN